MCTIFVGKILFSWASVSFKGGWVDVWVVHRQEGKKSQGMDPFIPDTVDPCCYGFLTIPPRECGAMRIIH